MADPDRDLGLVPYLVICTIGLLLISTILLKLYAHISIPSHAKFITWLSWILCFSIVYILPLDLRPHLGNSSAMYPFYVGLYWVCFFLTWILTPFQSAYIKSGGFDTKERIIDAVKLSALFFIIMIIVFVIAFVYLLFATELGASQLGAVLQAFGNLWGLSFAIMTMGYGLVEIPRYFWYKSNYDRRLQYFYFKLAQLQNDKENARDRVDELLYLYKKCKQSYLQLFVYEFAKIDEIIPSVEMLKIETNSIAARQHLDITFEDIDNTLDCGDFKRKHLRKMHMLFKIWLFQLERTNVMFKKTISDIFYFEDMIVKHRNNNHEYHHSVTVIATESAPNEESLNANISNDSKSGDMHTICHQIYWKSLPILSKSFAILLGILSILIIWSEAMIIFDYCGVSPYLSVFALINSNLSEVISIIFGVILFGYLSSCSLFALWRIHINKDYHMHPAQLTDSGSMLTNAAFSMRFMFPLGYNFLLMNINKVQRDEHKHLYPYLSLFHDMSVLPFIGDPINVFLPMLVLLFCCATCFNLYGKLMKKLRISRFEFADPESRHNEEIREWIKEGINISRKFKKELMNDECKKRQFIQFIHDKFKKTTFSKQYSWTQSSLNLNDIENVSLVSKYAKQQDIVKNKQNNKHQFAHIQLQQSN